LLDNAHIGTVCTKPEFAADACPDRSYIGQAEVATPLLEKPLTGPVFLRSSSSGLPDIAIDLRGQIHITVIGRVDSVKARLRATFQAVPDAPVGRFTVNFIGGSKGLVQNSESLCGTHKKANVQMTSQNGKTFVQHPELQAACGSQPKSRNGRRQQRHLERARAVRSKMRRAKGSKG
jgi:hypothetical protein